MHCMRQPVENTVHDARRDCRCAKGALSVRTNRSVKQGCGPLPKALTILKIPNVANDVKRRSITGTQHAKESTT